MTYILCISYYYYMKMTMIRVHHLQFSLKCLMVLAVLAGPALSKVALSSL